MKNILGKTISLVLIASAGLGGYVAGTQPAICQQVVLRDLDQHAAFAAKLAKYTGTEDFLTAMMRGRK